MRRTGEWKPDAKGNPRTWWYAGDVAEKPGVVDETYIADFSSRELPGQDLDVAAPGAWVLGAYQVNQGQQAFYYPGGTSMAAPHVAGLVALMAEKDPGLTQTETETILESTAVQLHTTTTPHGTQLDARCTEVRPAPGAKPAKVCWGSDATGAGLVNAVDALEATAELAKLG